MPINKSINELLRQTISSNWEQPSLTDFSGVSYSYRDIARKIEKLHILFENCGIKPGDRIALCGRNSSNWAVAFFATMTYGAVVVPLLNEFKPESIQHLLNHSEAKLLFVDEGIWENLDPAMLGTLLGALSMRDYSVVHSVSVQLDDARAHLNEYFGRKYPERFVKSDFKVYDSKEDDLALINYTSGSTGFSKGVMLSHKALWSNVQFCRDNLTMLNRGDGLVSMLPMAHMYGLMIEIVYPFIRGCHIYFLTRTPSPRVIAEAFAKVHPKVIVSVPLIIEKIIKTQVFPLLEKPLMKILLHVPFIDDRLLNKIKTKLNAVFGGQLDEMIIGGAALNHEVEVFLNRIGFPVTVGYGMTECAPLISYVNHNVARAGSCGKVVDRMKIRVDSPDPEKVPGVLYVKGDNVMLGYYKNEEATKAEIDKNGWLRTGDICVVDKDGYIFLRGRSKNMILGPSGQNIYPEEIEPILNNMPFVNESIVIQEPGHKLVALIHPDYDAISMSGHSEHDTMRIMQENIEALNKEVPSYCRVSSFRLMTEEFEKTPKRSIKRYLYQHNYE